MPNVRAIYQACAGCDHFADGTHRAQPRACDHRPAHPAEKIRENRKTMELKVAVNKAVDDCIKEEILEDFLREQRAEVIAMSIYEYDQEIHMQVVKEESWEDGQNKMLLLIEHMRDNDEIHLLDNLRDKYFLQQMYEKYNL